ncbi:MAG: FeoB-associated Cys-rich membrane protein [Cyclobacteriaceae bacterium]|nr:FeoB-associated Cys-rich membrane protein [Cyclobacteriaceae bacterium]
MRSCVALLLCLVAFVTVSIAQNTQPEPVGPQSLRQQYAHMKSDLDVINGFRMVKLYEMDQLWRVVEDSLKVKRAAINRGELLVKTQAAEIDSLKQQVARAENAKQELVSNVANINAYGMTFSKEGFVTFVTTVIIGLLVLAAALFVISRMAFKSSRESKKVSDDLYKEFEDYKHVAVEKNIKLSRELQSLKNRMAELKIA